MEEKDIETEVIHLDEIPQENKPSLMKEIFSFLRDVIISLIIGLLLIHFVIRPVQVEGSSMYPTLQNRAIGVSNLLGYRMDGIKRFDIVIIYEEESDKYLVKRAIGLPGETISFKNGKLYINGEKTAEDFLNSSYKDSYNGVFTDDMDEITLGEEEYFCMGDNRPHSTDSRYYGPFKRDRIISKGIMILYPLNQFGPRNW
jgi:signal peptidase I